MLENTMKNGKPTNTETSAMRLLIKATIPKPSSTIKIQMFAKQLHDGIRDTEVNYSLAIKKRHWQFICKLINEETELTYIKDFLDAKVPKAVNKDKLRAIRTFYALKTTEPNTLEKTMTPAQLFQMNSPFWAENLELAHIEKIQLLHQMVKSDAFFEHFNELLDPNKYYEHGWQLSKDYRI